MKKVKIFKNGIFDEIFYLLLLFAQLRRDWNPSGRKSSYSTAWQTMLMVL